MHKILLETGLITALIFSVAQKMSIKTVAIFCVNFVAVIGTCPPATPSNYDTRSSTGKFYIAYSHQKKYNEAKTTGPNGCPTGYQLMEWRNAEDWATARHYAGDSKLGTPMWTGLWNRDGEGCSGTGCHSKFVWLSDNSIQSYNPTDNMEGKSDELCLQVINAI